tara:strand:- start:4366 stop:4692 length:327 start_codon:yes stop_codon:yes gene_type:complete
MATIQIVDNLTVTIADTPQALYTAPASQSVIIESFTAANTSAVSASYKAYITSSFGATQPQIPYKIVVWNENDLGIGIVNQIIPAGGTLKIECSALASIYFTVTGREI